MRPIIPEKIKERRLELSLTQAELARKTGISRVYIIELERGRKIPRVTMIDGIAYALKVRERYFICQKRKQKLTEK